MTEFVSTLSEFGFVEWAGLLCIVYGFYILSQLAFWLLVPILVVLGAIAGLAMVVAEDD